MMTMKIMVGKGYIKLFFSTYKRFFFQKKVGELYINQVHGKSFNLKKKLPCKDFAKVSYLSFFYCTQKHVHFVIIVVDGFFYFMFYLILKKISHLKTKTIGLIVFSILMIYIAS